MTTEKTYTAAELAPLLNKQQPADIIQMWRDGKFPHAKLENSVLRIPESDAKPFLDAVAVSHSASDSTTAAQEVIPEESIDLLPETTPADVAESAAADQESHVEDAPQEQVLVSPCRDVGLETPESIVAEAKAKADAIIAAANEEAILIRADANTEQEHAYKDAADMRNGADSYAANTRAAAEKYAADKVKDADFYYGERHETADKYFDTKLSESTKSYEEAIASRKTVIAELDKAIESRKTALQKAADAVKAIETQYRKIISAAQKNQSYYYNLAQHDLWGRFLDWARRMVQSSAK